MADVQFSPSLLSANFVQLARDIALIEQGAPEWLHVDVMDGHFVPNLTIGPPVVRAIKAITRVPLDVHLMIDNPHEQLDWFLDAGANLLTVHVECGPGGVAAAAQTAGQSRSVTAAEDPDYLFGLLERIRLAGCKAGISLNPGTPVSAVVPFLPAVDLVLVMSVHPGFGGQAYIPGATAKIAELAALRSQLTSAGRPGFQIEVDGGINPQTAQAAAAAGADILVAGNAIFAAPDPASAMQKIRSAVES